MQPSGRTVFSGHSSIGQLPVLNWGTADQKRRLALALNRERVRSGKSSQMILLTAITHHSKTTSLAFDLAKDFGNMDVSAVVVEVNTVKTDTRYISESVHGGVYDLLNKPDTPLQQLISPADGQLPNRIALAAPNEGLLSGYLRLQGALAKLSEQYEMIILDAAPVLLSADVEFFASISDITLLLIAAQETQPGEIKRAVQILERVDPKVISFVVTRLQVFKGGGYYAKVYAGKAGK